MKEFKAMLTEVRFPCIHPDEVKRIWLRRCRQFFFEQHPTLYVLTTQHGRTYNHYLRFFESYYPIQIESYHQLMIKQLEKKYKKKLVSIDDAYSPDAILYSSRAYFLDTFQDEHTHINYVASALHVSNYDEAIKLLEQSVHKETPISPFITLIAMYYKSIDDLPHDKYFLVNRWFGSRHSTIFNISSREYSQLRDPQLFKLLLRLYSIWCSYLSTHIRPYEVFAIDRDTLETCPYDLFFHPNRDILRKPARSQFFSSINNVSRLTLKEIVRLLKKVDSLTYDEVFETVTILKNFNASFLKNVKQIEVPIEKQLSDLVAKERRYLTRQIYQILAPNLDRKKTITLIEEILRTSTQYRAFVKNFNLLKTAKKRFEYARQFCKNDKNLSYDLLKLFNKDPARFATAFGGASSLRPSFEKHPILTRLLPAILRPDYIMLVDNAVDRIMRYDRRLGHDIVNVLRKFRFDLDQQLHDVVTVLNEVTPRRLRKFLPLIKQLSPNMSTLNIALEAIRILNMASSFNEENPVIKDVLKIRSIHQLVKNFDKLQELHAEIMDEITARTLKQLKDKDQVICPTFTLSLSSAGLKVHDALFSAKCVFKEWEHKLSPEFTVYFRAWDSLIGAAAPDGVSCCTRPTHYAYKDYAAHPYTYNMVIVHETKQIALWALLTLVHDRDDNVYLLLDNIEASNKFVDQLEAIPQDRLWSIVFDYIDMLNNVSKNKFYIGQYYNDIEINAGYESVDDLSFIIPLAYTDALDNNAHRIYVIER